MVSIDSTLEFGKVYRMASLNDLPQLGTIVVNHDTTALASRSVVKTHVFADHMEAFRDLHHLPDPLPGEEGHYAPFSEVYGTATTEQHRPSLQVKNGRQKTLPFTASISNMSRM